MINQGLPWNQESGDRKRLQRIVAGVLPIFFVMAVYVTWVDLPEQEREELEALPPQLAKVMLKKKEPPKPVLKKKEKPVVPEKVKKETVAKKEPPKKKPKPVIAKKPRPETKKAKPEEIAKARAKAKKTGLLAMSSQLSKLSAIADSVKLDTPKTITAKPIARKQTDQLASRVAQASSRSTGVDESKFNTESAKLEIAAYSGVEVEAAEQIADVVAEEQAAKELFLAQRTSEELRRVMDANKSVINSIYNRALRKKPSLQGTLTSRLVIEENGVVSSCDVVDSTLNEPRLESKICNRLRLVDFGAKPGVEKFTFNYPIELLPG